MLVVVLGTFATAACGSDSTAPPGAKFTLGGTLTGLTAGKSLVLQNNGGDNRSLTADGAFTFATSLSGQADYAVTVSTQPSGMFCGVANGGGTIAAADVTNVAVDCADITTTLDPTFGAGNAGFATFDRGSSLTDSGNEVALDGSGRLVVVGHSLNSATGALEMALWRVDTTGTLDGGFGSGGQVFHPGEIVADTLIPEVIGTGVAVDGSGRVVVAGYQIDASGIWGVAVWRFTSNGTPDATFGNGGLVRTTSPQSGGVAVALDGSQKILVSGFAWNGTDWDAAVWRFNTDGSPDSTFNGIGYVSQNYSALSGGTAGEDIGVGVSVDGSGRIVMAGYSGNAAGNQDMTVWRFTSGGLLDNGFNGTGVFRHDNAAGGSGNDVGRTVAFDASGRIVVVGWSPSPSGGDDTAVWRLTTTGALDLTFNGTGYNTQGGTAGGNGVDTGRDVVIDPNGRVVIVGESANAAGDQDMVVWRFGSDGRLDGAFGGTGFLLHGGAAGGTGGNDGARGIVIDGSDRIVVAGRSVSGAGTQDMTVWRVVP
jgi:uncharacterized delta-60 repeat protein